MRMKNPVHPGKLVKANLDEIGLSVVEAAKAIGVTRQQLYNVIGGKSAVTPEMAVRFEKAFGGSADLWLSMQAAYDLARVRLHDKDIIVDRLFHGKNIIPMTRTVLAILAATLLVSAVHAAPNQRSGQSCRINLSKFEMLEHGMTYAEAKEVIGCAGKQFSYMENVGNNVTIYFWNGPGCDGCSGAYVTFANDSLEKKSQVGLDE